jgi:hypothetical protein
MEFGSGTMTNTPYMICYFNGPFLVACPRVLEIVEPALSAAHGAPVRRWLFTLQRMAAGDAERVWVVFDMDELEGR